MFPLALPLRHAPEALRRVRQDDAAVAADCDYELSFDGACAQAYNEEAFRHFLGLERVRAARLDRSFLLLLVSLRKEPGAGAEMHPAMAKKLLAALGQCVREVDFIGWYRTGRVAGAVLAQGTPVPGADVPHRISERVVSVLSTQLPSHAARRLNVRVLQLRRRPR